MSIVRTTPKLAIQLQQKVKFPEKLKGTIIEKWANYWKNLFIDYRQMLQDLKSDIQDNPTKSMTWTAALVTAYGLATNNPNERDFKDSLKQIENDIGIVSEECQNPKSVQHVRFLEMSNNQDVLHYRSFGIISFMYTSEINESCDLYKAHCSYLKPSYFSFPSRIVDVGFMGKWWNLYIKTTNYDVNLKN